MRQGLYHLHAQIIGRGKKITLKPDGGKATQTQIASSPVASAAYRAGISLRNEQDGQLYDYSRKRVAYSEILLPAGAPEILLNRSYLWNSVERSESRKDAQFVREFNIALPKELNQQQKIELMQSYVKACFTDKGMCADMALHTPDKENENPHFHVMVTMRDFDQDGSWLKKNRAWNESSLFSFWREKWADICNAQLARHGLDLFIDHRTLEQQGQERIPTIHLGKKATALECMGITTDKGDVNRSILTANSLLALDTEQGDALLKEQLLIMQDLASNTTVLGVQETMRGVIARTEELLTQRVKRREVKRVMEELPSNQKTEVQKSSTLEQESSAMEASSAAENASNTMPTTLPTQQATPPEKDMQGTPQQVENAPIVADFGAPKQQASPAATPQKKQVATQSPPLESVAPAPASKDARVTVRSIAERLAQGRGGVESERRTYTSLRDVVRQGAPLHLVETEKTLPVAEQKRTSVQQRLDGAKETIAAEKAGATAVRSSTQTRRMRYVSSTVKPVQPVDATATKLVHSQTEQVPTSQDTQPTSLQSAQQPKQQKAQSQTKKPLSANGVPLNFTSSLKAHNTAETRNYPEEDKLQSIYQTAQLLNTLQSKGVQNFEQLVANIDRMKNDIAGLQKRIDALQAETTHLNKLATNTILAAKVCAENRSIMATYKNKFFLTKGFYYKEHYTEIDAYIVAVQQLGHAGLSEYATAQEVRQEMRQRIEPLSGQCQACVKTVEQLSREQDALSKLKRQAEGILKVEARTVEKKRGIQKGMER